MCEEWEFPHRLDGFWKVCVDQEFGMPEQPESREVDDVIHETCLLLAKENPSLILWLFSILYCIPLKA